MVLTEFRPTIRPGWGALADLEERHVADVPVVVGRMELERAGDPLRRPPCSTPSPASAARRSGRTHPSRRISCTALTVVVACLMGGSGRSAHGPAPVLAMPLEKRRISRCWALTSCRWSGTTVRRSGYSPPRVSVAPGRGCPERRQEPEQVPRTRERDAGDSREPLRWIAGTSRRRAYRARARGATECTPSPESRQGDHGASGHALMVPRPPGDDHQPSAGVAATDGVVVHYARPLAKRAGSLIRRCGLIVVRVGDGIQRVRPHARALAQPQRLVRHGSASMVSDISRPMIPPLSGRRAPLVPRSGPLPTARVRQPSTRLCDARRR